MKTIIRNVINSRNYELADMLRKLDKLWLEGGIDDAEREELAEMARGNVNMEKGYAAFEERMLRLEKRVTALEEFDNLQTDAPEQTEEYPAWVQPTGAHDAYYTGAKMTYTDGKKYTCTAPDGYAVAYGPDILPGMWQVEE